jgi:hypothetical protein
VIADRTITVNGDILEVLDEMVKAKQEEVQGE